MSDISDLSVLVLNLMQIDLYIYIPYMIYYEIIVGNPRLITHHSTREERCLINGRFPMML